MAHTAGATAATSAAGIDPVAQLLSVVDTRELDSAVDRAAVLGWRLDDTGYTGSVRCRGYPPFPHLAHEMWGSYLAARAATVMELAARIRASAMLRDRRGLGRVRDSHHPT